MSKLKPLLGGLLVLQIVAALGLYWQGQQLKQGRQSQPLLSFDTAGVNKVILSDGTLSVTLSKSAGVWQLPDSQQLPVDTSQLEPLLARLQGLQTGWPVATSSPSRERFEVAEGKFQRRIQLFEGATQVAELLVGTSPGFRKSHVRRPEDNAIYSVELSSYELPTENRNWLDKTLLSPGIVERIEGRDYTLIKSGEEWRLAEEENSGELPLDDLKARQLAAALSDFRVLEIADASPEKGETLDLQVSGPGGSWTYQFVQSGEDYFVSRNDRETVFKLAKSDYERIAGVGLPQLALKEPEPATEDNAATQT